MAEDCQTCGRTFVNVNAASQHMSAVGHWACQVCDLTWWDKDAAVDHMNQQDHWSPAIKLERRSTIYDTSQRAEQPNYRAQRRHSWYGCERTGCGRTFGTQRELQRHLDQANHQRPRHGCETCNLVYATPQEARRHMSQVNHFRSHWCDHCNRGFASENGLQMHLDSNVHRGSTLLCPFCRRAFTSAAGVTSHIESAACPNARSLNREVIFHELNTRDPKGLITNKMLTHRGPSQQTTMATTATWNGKGYECYLCHKLYMDLKTLNSHVNSLVHMKTLYHCPGRKCRREFSSLSCLFKHLESEVCGTVRFEAVQQNIGNFLSGGRKAIGFGAGYWGTGVRPGRPDQRRPNRNRGYRISKR